MQEANPTRTKRRTDKNSGKFFDLEQWGSFRKALRIGALVHPETSEEEHRRSSSASKDRSKPFCTRRLGAAF